MWLQNVGPILIFCSEDDELAPYPVVSNFAQRLEELGGDVRLVEWNSSPHVGMFLTNISFYFCLAMCCRTNYA